MEQCATFAAARDYELLKRLSSDRRALATARRLGLRIGGVHFGNSHWPQSSQPQPRSGQPAEQPTNRQQVSTASVKAPNSAQRRSKERRQTFLEKKGSQDGRAAFSPTPPGPEPGEPSEVDTTERDADGKEPVASGGQRGQKRATGETPASNLQP